MAREVPYQVIQQPTVLPQAVPVSSGQLLGQNIKALLEAGLQAAASGLQEQSQKTQEANTFAEAETKLVLANDQLQNRLGIAKADQAQNTQNNIIQTANTLLAESEKQRAELEDKIKLGIAATIATKPLTDVEKLISRPDGFTLDPDAMAYAEELYGKRLAQEDLPKALNTITVEVQKNPNASFSAVIDGVAGGRQFSSPIVQANYLSTLRNNADRYFTSKQLEATEQRLKDGISTLGLDTIHKWNFDLKENKLDGPSIYADIKSYVDGYRKLKPGASDLEVLSSTSDLLNAGFNKDFVQANLPQLEQVYGSIHQLADVSPEFAPVIGALGDRISKVKSEQQAANAEIAKAGIDGAQDGADLGKQVSAFETAAQKGSIAPASVLELRNQAVEQAKKIQLNQDVLNKANGANISLTPDHDQYIDQYISRLSAGVQSATGQPFSMADEAAVTFQRFGVLTSRQVGNINNGANTPYDPKNPASLDVANQSFQALAAMDRANPTGFANYLNGSKLSEKVKTGYRLYKDLGVSIRELSSNLAPIKDGYLSEARAVLNGDIRDVATGNRSKLASQSNGLANIDEIVRDAGYSGQQFLDRSVNYVDASADDAFRSAFEYEYAKGKEQGLDPVNLTATARTAASSLVQRNYVRADFGGDRYLVSASSRFAPITEAQKAANENISRLWGPERNKLVVKYWTLLEDPRQIHLDLSNVERDANGNDVFRVLQADGSPLPRTGATGTPYETFVVPSDPIKLKELVDTGPAIDYQKAKQDAFGRDEFRRPTGGGLNF